MENFFQNLHTLLIRGRYFIKNKLSSESKENVLSFSIFSGFIIGAFHVLGFITAFKQAGRFETVGLAFAMVAGAILYTSIVFAKSGLFYYLTGLYKKDEKPVSARTVLKTFFLSAYPFFLLPAAGLLSSIIDSFSIFVLIYLLICIWVTVSRYRSLKSVLKTHEFIFKLTYIIPVIAQITLVFAIIAFAAVSNLIIIKTLVESIIKTVLSFVQSLSV